MLEDIQSQREMYLRNYRKLDARQTHKEIHLRFRKIRKTTGCWFFCLDSFT